MTLYAISYDLHREKDYQTLWDALDELGAHKALNSFYLVNLTDEDPQSVVSYLAQYIDDDDHLIAVRFIGRPRYTKAKRGTNDWVKENT